MKTLIKSAIVAGICLLAAGGANAQSISNQNSNWNLTSSSQTFTFSQFNPSLGNLTAAQFLINSASVSGDASVTNSTGEEVTIDFIRSRISVSGTGFTSGNTPLTQLTTSPNSSGFTLDDGDSQVFTINSQSILSSTFTRNITSSLLSYVGTGLTPSFTLFLNSSMTATPTPSTTFNLLAPNTSVTLRYTYTPSVNPVPEPGQVAASLLLLGGIGGYVFIKRRRKPAVAAA